MDELMLIWVVSPVQDTVRYSLANASNDGMQYFLLEERTGILRLKKPLTGAKEKYNVSAWYSTSNCQKRIFSFLRIVQFV